MGATKLPNVTSVQIDADGTWDVVTFDSGVKQRTLRTPSAAYITARAALNAAPVPVTLESRVAALEAKAGIASPTQ